MYACMNECVSVYVCCIESFQNYCVCGCMCVCVCVIGSFETMYTLGGTSNYMQVLLSSLQTLVCLTFMVLSGIYVHVWRQTDHKCQV
jgi:hypothetical protein